MRTRPLVEGDLDACADLFVTVFNKEPWNDCWTVELAMDYFRDIYNTPGFHGFVLEAKAESLENFPRIIGFIIGTRKRWWSGDIFYLYEMCVDEAYQGKGIGKQLMSDTKMGLIEKGYTAIVLLTERIFPAARFYEKHGFMESTDTRFYFCSL